MQRSDCLSMSGETEESNLQLLSTLNDPFLPWSADPPAPREPGDPLSDLKVSLSSQPFPSTRLFSRRRRRFRFAHLLYPFASFGIFKYLYLPCSFFVLFISFLPMFYLTRAVESTTTPKQVVLFILSSVAVAILLFMFLFCWRSCKKFSRQRVNKSTQTRLSRFIFCFEFKQMILKNLIIKTSQLHQSTKTTRKTNTDVSEVR